MLRRLLLAALVLVVALSSHGAEAARVRVRGSAKLTARATHDVATHELLLVGQLTDDAGQSLPFETVRVHLAHETDPVEGHGLAALSHGRPCAAASGRPGGGGVQSAGKDTSDVLLAVDGDGRYCLRVPLEQDRFRAVVSYAPTTGLVDGTTRELVFDLSKRSIELRFDPVPRIVALDTTRLTFEAVAVADSDALPTARGVAPGLAVVLSNEKEELAHGTTNASGRVRFAVEGQKLGAPGPGELRLAFAGDAETARAAAAEEVERHVKVAVKVPAADRGELAPAIPEDGIPLVAEVTSSAGPVGEGAVEARIGDVVVGAAPVDHGTARMLVTFTGHSGKEAALRMRYVPSAPWFEPLGEPTVRIPIRGPSVFAKAPIVIAGLAVLFVFLFGRVSAQKNKPEPKPAEPKPGEGREGKPSLEVIRPATRGSSGWTGSIVDAHEGQALRGIRVWIERGTFDGRTVVASVETDVEGRFVLPGIGEPAGDETICAEGRYHARLARALPPPGEVAIALAQRRRALLASLVSWAKRKGPPFDVRPEPTPGHIKRVASAEQETLKWAEAVERAAFGPGDVDARIEQEIEKLEPDRRS